MLFREYTQEDFFEVRQLFYDAVHSIKLRDYNRSQLSAWAPPLTHNFYGQLSQGLIDGTCFIAKENGQVVGFGNLCPDGVLEHLFVDEEFQGQKVASSILSKIEAEAKALGIKEITAEVSEVAKQAALEKGFELIQPLEKTYGSQVLQFYLMRKSI